MKTIEWIKLLHRARRYQHHRDRGGIAFIKSTIEEGQAVFDIGAHKAGYLYFMLKQVGPTGNVYAFEPQSHLFHYLRNLKEVFDWHNVMIEQKAMSDVIESATLFIPKNGRRSSTGATITGEPLRASGSATEQVSTDTIDAYCQRNSIIPALLKIDVEGNELKVLQGSVNTLRSHKPKILVEIEARHVGVDQAIRTFDFLRSLGYRGQFIHGAQLLPLEQFDFAQHQDVADTRNYCNNFIFD